MAINLDEESMKALYQRGIANKELKNFDEAVADFRKARKLDPDDFNIGSQLYLVRNEINKLNLKDSMDK